MKKKIIGREMLPFIHNVLYTETGKDGLIAMKRFTPEQVKRYVFDSGKLNGDFYPATFASSSMLLDMVTDSTFIGLNFRWKNRTKSMDNPIVDLFVDNALTDSYRIDKDTAHELAMPLPGGKHRVRLYFPWGAEFRLGSIVLSEGASAEPVPVRKMRILAFGDSITQGYIGCHSSLNYVNGMSRALEAEVLNQAIGGYFFVAESLDPALRDWKPDLITVAYGINDYVFRPEKEVFVKEASAYMEKLCYLFPDTPVLALLPIASNSLKTRMRALIRDFSLPEAKDELRKIYEKYPNVTVLEDDYYPRLPEFYAPDGLHPSDMGFLLYGQAVTEKIRSMDIDPKA